MRHHRADQFREAEALYRHIHEAHPDHPEASHLLGVAAQQQGRYGAAADLIARAVARDPKYAKAYGNLGVALAAGGELDAAWLAV